MRLHLMLALAILAPTLVHAQCYQPSGCSFQQSQPPQIYQAPPPVVYQAPPSPYGQGPNPAYPNPNNGYQQQPQMYQAPGQPSIEVIPSQGQRY
jgi:hypothetical protein